MSRGRIWPITVARLALAMVWYPTGLAVKPVPTTFSRLRRHVAMAALLLGLGGSGGACTPHPGPTREVVVIARGMSFVLEDAPDTANPAISLRAGERVRLVLRNEAPGLMHDIVIPDLGVEIEPMRAGETRELTFTAPATPGRHEYHCRPHAELMHGVVEVVP